MHFSIEMGMSPAFWKQENQISTEIWQVTLIISMSGHKRVNSKWWRAWNSYWLQEGWRNKFHLKTSWSHFVQEHLCDLLNLSPIFFSENWSHFSNQPVSTYPYWWCWRGGRHRQEPSNCWTWYKRCWGHCGSSRAQWQCGVSSLTTSIATTHGNTWSWEAITCWTNQVYAWNNGRQI